jgi:hypothetical protein
MAQELLDCLAGLPRESLNELYGDVCCCIAVLRCLPPLARQVLMRLAFLEQVDASHMLLFHALLSPDMIFIVPFCTHGVPEEA